MGPACLLALDWVQGLRIKRIRYAAMEYLNSQLSHVHFLSSYADFGLVVACLFTRRFLYKG